MTKLNLLNRFTIDRDLHSKNHSIFFTDESLTVQADAAQSDINNIVKQFGLTHQLPYGNATPRYDDYVDSPSDFHAAMNFIKDSEGLFMEYPAQIRAEFNNDPGNFLSFIQNPKNRERSIELGFIDAPIEEALAPNSKEPTSPPADASVAQSST